MHHVLCITGLRGHGVRDSLWTLRPIGFQRGFNPVPIYSGLHHKLSFDVMLRHRSLRSEISAVKTAISIMTGRISRLNLTPTWRDP